MNTFSWVEFAILLAIIIVVQSSVMIAHFAADHVLQISGTLIQRGSALPFNDNRTAATLSQS